VLLSALAARPRRWLAAAAVGACLATATPARAFELEGHFVIEAVAYKRLLALARVPGTDASGRDVLAALIAARVLVEPPCFDVARARGGCSDRDPRTRARAFLPVLGAGAADILIDRQVSARGQCQHFMAQPGDGLTPIDPRFGVPGGMVTAAYSRCVEILGVAFSGLLRNPALAQRRLVGTYALMHAIQDSFSTAHTARDGEGRIEYLLSWKLIDWPSYFAHGRASFPARTHHAITDGRDGEYLRRDGRADDGSPCGAFHEAYATPESCLTPQARAAADAVVDLLVLAYELRARAAAEMREASLSSPDDLASWRAYVHKHLASAAVATDAPAPAGWPAIPRADTFVGAQGAIADDGWAAGLWAGRMFYGPAVPFALAVSGAALFDSHPAGRGMTAALGAGLYLPLIRRFAVGITPAGVSARCDPRLEACSTTVFATLGEVIVPLADSIWFGVQGPRWSWDERALRGPLVAVALGWSHEQAPVEPITDPAEIASWTPPDPSDVVEYRLGRVSWLAFGAAAAGSTTENRWIGGGVELRVERDRWGRRSGWAPALSLEVASGTMLGTNGVTATLAPALRRYLLADRLWLGVAPAALRVGAQDGQSLAIDVAGYAALGLVVGRLEMSLASPQLSYVARDHWHALPIAVRLGLLFN